MFQIPEPWEISKLPEIADINMGQSPSSSDVNEHGEGIVFFQGKAEFGKLYPTPKKYCTKPTKIASAGDILLSVRAPVGPTNLANQSTAIGRGLAAISANHGLMESKYLLYFFKCIEPWLSTQGTGSTFKAISGQFIRDLQSPVPPLAEQKIIVEKLDTLLAQVESTKARLEQIPQILKRFRQAVLAAATSGKLVSEININLSYSKWDNVKLIEVIQTKPRNGYSPKGVDYLTDVKNLTLSATTRGYFDENCFKYVDVIIPRDSHLWLKDGDFLIQRANSLEYVGVSALYNGKDDQFIYPDLMMKFRANEKIHPKYLYYSLQTEKTRKYFRDNATGTTGNMPKINQTVVSNTPINLPSLPEQAEIVRRVEQLFAYADTIEKQVNNALARVNNLTQSILAKAFRGELTAQWRAENPDLISGENSAAALLEKIKAERAASGGKKASRKKS